MYLLIARSCAGFSTQVFSEFCNNATRKLAPWLSHAQDLAFLEPLMIDLLLPNELSGG
jgi:hypothetical protein